MEPYLKIDAVPNRTKIDAGGKALSIMGLLGSAAADVLAAVLPELPLSLSPRERTRIFCETLEGQLCSRFGDRWDVSNVPQAKREKPSQEDPRPATAEEAMAIMDRLDAEKTRRMLRMQMDRMAEMMTGCLPGRTKSPAYSPGSPHCNKLLRR